MSVDTGLIGTAVGLGVLLGVTGLAFRAIEQTFPDDRRKGRRRQPSFFELPSDRPKGKRKARGADDIFDLGLTQRPRGKRRFRSDFGQDFNIFAV